MIKTIFMLLFFQITVSPFSYSQQNTKVNHAANADSLSSKKNHLGFGNALEEGASGLGHFLIKIPEDNYRFVKNDVTLKKLPVYLGIAGLTGALMHFDQSGWRFEHNLYSNSSFYHRSADALVFMGNGEFHFILSGVFAAYGLAFNNNRALITSGRIAEAVLSSGLFVQVLKRITGRESPAAASHSKGVWRFFPNIDQYQDAQSKYYSYPSGHLASAMATLTVIANEYPDSKWIKPVGYTILGAIGFSLVERGMHWYSDLPLGLFIGYSFGNLIAPPRDDSPVPHAAKSNLTIMPSAGLNNFGLDINYSF